MSGRKKVKKGVAPRGGKHPSASATPSGSKRPVVAREPSDHPQVIWRLEMADWDGEWGLGNFMSHHGKAVFEKLREWEKLSTGELFNMPGNKPIPVHKIVTRAQTRIKDLRREEHADNLWELRLTGTQRFWGFRYGCLFYVLWWDPDHLVCPSKLKHT